MKVLFLTLEFSVGTFSGNGVYAQSQVRALRQLGHRVLVICGRPEGAEEADDAVAAGLVQVPLPVWGRLDAGCAWREFAAGAAAAAVVRSVSAFAPDMAVGVDWHSVAAYDALAAGLRALGDGPPVPRYVFSSYRVHLRSAVGEEERSVVAELEGRALGRAACAVVLCRADAEAVAELYPASCPRDPGRLRVLLPALRADLARIPPPRSEEQQQAQQQQQARELRGLLEPAAPPAACGPPRRRFLACCVRASPEKEPHRFVDLVCELQRRGALQRLGVTPLVCGAGWAGAAGGAGAAAGDPGYGGRLRGRLRAEAPSCVVVDAFLDAAGMAEIYAATALNVHPPLCDAYGMTIVEAASQGAPSLVHGGGGVGATDLLSGAAGQVCLTDMAAPVEALADEVERLLANDGALRRVGAAAMAAARAYGEAANAEELVRLLQRALAFAPPPPPPREPCTTAFGGSSGSGGAAPHSAAGDGPMEGVVDPSRLQVGVDGRPHAAVTGGLGDGAQRQQGEVVHAVCAGGEARHDGTGVGEGRQRGGVDVRGASELQYHEFVGQYLDPGRPVILTGATEGWAAGREWVAGGVVDVDFLERRFGGSWVVVTDTARCHLGISPCREMTVAQYCQWWRQRKGRAGVASTSGAQVQAGGGGDHGRWQPAGEPADAELLYLKDWHFAAAWPEYEAYACPPIFSDDWLNFWLDSEGEAAAGRPRGSGAAQAGHIPAPPQGCYPEEEGAHASGGASGGAGACTSDYRFVYLGAAGTRTPLHADVLRSHSWSANVAGRKRWRLLPPAASHLLRDRAGRATFHDFYADVDNGQPAAEGDGAAAASSAPKQSVPGPSPAAATATAAAAAAEFPALREARRHLLEVVQLPGEALFVPSGWWHTVDNLDDCLSINHNWVSRQSVAATWVHLREERAAAAAQIADCAALCRGLEFESLVQRNAAANCGMNYFGFGAMVRCVARGAVEVVEGLGARPLGGLAARLTREEAVAEAALRLQAARAVLVELRQALREIIAVAAARPEAAGTGAPGATPADGGHEHERARFEEAEEASSQCLDSIHAALRRLHNIP